LRKKSAMRDNTKGSMTKKPRRKAPESWLHVIDQIERVCIRAFEAVERVAFRAALVGCFVHEVYRFLSAR
jgi:hypothetical protein